MGKIDFWNEANKLVEDKDLKVSDVYSKITEFAIKHNLDDEQKRYFEYLVKDAIGFIFTIERLRNG